MTSVIDLEQILEDNKVYLEEETDLYDEVYPRLYLADEDAAQDPDILKELGVTHVLNAAFGPDDMFQSFIDPIFYSDMGIKFLGINALDHHDFDMEQHFETSSRFIQSALDSSTDACVMVHCVQGLSRSATLVLAYLVTRQGFNLTNALKQVVKRRHITPNPGFLYQLCHLENKKI